jgi:ATP-dependent Clp protease ATP-binding subunit ClpA
MFERFTDDARAVVTLASEHARRLGHRYVGGEHLLLAAVTAGQPASTVMCEHGVTPELVEEEIVRRVGLGAGAGRHRHRQRGQRPPPPGPRRGARLRDRPAR